MSSPYRPIPLGFERLSPVDMGQRARAYADAMERRRSVRDFSAEPIPDGVIDDALRAAASAPSGAHQQPWSFVVVKDAALKAQIRHAAEVEEEANWNGRMSEEWRTALAPLGVDCHKPHLTTAPVVIVVFARVWGIRQTDAGPVRVKHYYVDESCGIAVGMLLSALHLAGLATLTHTPSPMRFLRDLLDRPDNERAYIVIPVGYPAAGATVPDLQRRPLSEVVTYR